MDYQALLNYLIDITDMKIGSLARILNYDISYISKWTHGKRKPSKNSINEVNKILAQIFAQSIIKNNTVEKVSYDLSFNLSKSSKEKLIFASLEKNIYSYLNLAFYDKLEVKKKASDNSINYIIGHTEIENALINIFKQIFASEKENLNIWVNIPILSNFSSFFLNLISNYKKDFQTININFLYSRRFIINDVRKIFEIFSKYADINFELYENNAFEKLSFISIDEHFFADISFKGEKLLTMTYSFDPLMARKFFTMANNNSKESNNIVRKIQSEDFNPTDFLSSFYSRDSYMVLLNYGLEYMIKDPLINEISLSHDLDMKSQIFFYKVSEILENFFERSDVDILIPSNTLKKCLAEKSCYFYTYKFNLEEELFDLYIENIINNLKKNPKFHFYTIDADIIYKKYPYSNFNIYYNKNTIYLKKILKECQAPLPTSYYIENSLFNDIISKDLKSIVNNPSTKELKYYQLRNIYKDIKKLPK